jgi:hypothetical protein
MDSVCGRNPVSCEWHWRTFEPNWGAVLVLDVEDSVLAPVLVACLVGASLPEAWGAVLLENAVVVSCAHVLMALLHL